ncbi:MAG: NAD(P)H-dependent oxidoreductase [Pseudomonadota bacterium]
MRRALVLYAHPVEESFGAALHAEAIAGLTRGGWEVDDCDLYAEGFDPVLSAAERRGYHDLCRNTDPVAGYVERLRAAEALVLCFPVWNFGYPAILKGFFDRVFLPGVSFRMEDGVVRPALTNIRRLAALCTYGGARWRVWAAGDPPRKTVTRSLRHLCHSNVRMRYVALHDMNRASESQRAAFLSRAGREMERL